VLKRVVTVVEVVALLAFCVFVALLFIKQPTKAPSAAAASNAEGAALYADHCASCHGSDGSGDIGPRLNGGAVTQKYPTAAAEVTFVGNGGGRMPAFKTQLTQAQLQAVVDYTRTVLQQN
jgi:mono/diheme cytochrome c family protein